MNELKIVNISIDAIKPYDNNPRNNDESIEYVRNSIEEFGFKQPIVIDKNNVIVAGHTRVLAAKELGFATVPCVLADDLTDEQVKAYRLADNKSAEHSTWDFNKLSQELDELEIDMSEFGFDSEHEFNEEALSDLFADAPEKEKEPKRIQCPHCGEWFEP